MRKLTVLLLLLLEPAASATKYYISNSEGSDASGRDGRSQSTSWKTISKINSCVFSPGDTILLRKGDTWRETLKVPSSGSPASFITFGSYGTGPNPRILGSEVSTGWTNYSGNIWVSNTSFTNPRTSFNCDIFFSGNDGSITWGLNKASAGSLVSDYDWTWTGNKIYVYSATNPLLRFASIEIPQRQACIDLNNREYLAINGIDLFYGIYEGITYDWNYAQLDLHGLVIENCNIAYIGGDITKYTFENGFGIDAAYTDMIVRKCDIHDCGRRSISFHLYGSGFTVKNVLIEQNNFHNGYHTTGVDISVGSGTYTGSFDGVTIRRNLFYDPPTSPFHSEQIFIQNYNYAGLQTRVNNILIYSNIFKSPSGSSIMAEGTQSVFIYNNTFYNHNTTKTGNVAHVWVDANNASIKIKNNIFYSDLNTDVGGVGMGIYSLTVPANVDADYNLYYRISNSLRIIKANSTNYYMNGISVIRSQLGWETHSPVPSAPLFINAANNDFTPGAGSPGIGTGLGLNLPVDYNGNIFTGIPNIGCMSTPFNNAPLINIITPAKNSTFTAPASIDIAVNANDLDGTLKKVEFYSGIAKIGEATVTPYSFCWKNVPAGTYLITAVATDNLDAITTSPGVELSVSVVTSDLPAEDQHDPNASTLTIFPNPNDGHFTLNLKEPLSGGNNTIDVFNLSGQRIYSGIIPKSELSREIDLSFLSSGIYILRLTGDKKVITKKFVKD